MTTESQAKNNAHLIRAIHDKANPYVMLNKQAMFDPNLSLEAVGLWARVLCHKDDWVIHVTQLMKANNCGRDKMYRILKELIANGYAYHGFERIKGQYSPGTWYIFESRKTPEEIKELLPFTENPYTVNPHSENLTLVNNDSLMSNKSNDIYTPLDSDECVPISSHLSDVVKDKSSKPSIKTNCVPERASHIANHEEFKLKFKVNLIGTSDEQHRILVEKHGEAIISKAYEELAQWKLSKAECEPKAITKHTDYHRLTKWVIPEVIKNPNPTAGSYKRTGKLAIEADKRVESVEDRPKVWTEHELETKISHKFLKRIFGIKDEDLNEEDQQTLAYVRKKGYDKTFNIEEVVK